MPNPSKKELLTVKKWIQSRAKKNLPLNIHAVRRERPKLLEIAYAGEAPRGWRRSLLDAGVSPYDIEHEFEEYIPCLICGREMTVLGIHLHWIHQVDKEAYRQEFGITAKLASEGYRSAHSKMLTFDDCPPHWEKLWSPEYVVDWILLLKELGMDLNYTALSLKGNSKRPLAAAALSHFGSWDHALLKAGLDPEEIRRSFAIQDWTKAKLLTAIRHFAKSRKRTPRAQMNNGMRSALRRFYGSTQAALKAAGVEQKAVNSRPKITLEEVAGVVTQIHKLAKFKGIRRKRELDKIYRNPKNSRVIMQAKSLKLLALKEGISIHLVDSTTFRDAADVHHELDLVEKKGMPLTHNSLIKLGHYRLYNVIRNTGWGAERMLCTTPLGTVSAKPWLGPPPYLSI